MISVEGGRNIYGGTNQRQLRPGEDYPLTRVREGFITERRTLTVNGEQGTDPTSVTVTTKRNNGPFGIFGRETHRETFLGNEINRAGLMDQSGRRVVRYRERNPDQRKLTPAEQDLVLRQGK